MKKVYRKLYIALIVGNIICCDVYAQKDLSKFVKPVYQGLESTALSIFDTSPESPDCKHLCFIRYPSIVQGGHGGPEVKADVMIKDIRTGKVEKIYEVWCTNHNGANGMWMNDSIVTFQVNHMKDFVVFNIYTKTSMFGLVEGELGHKSFNNFIYYSKCNGRLLGPDSSRNKYQKEEEGIYQLNFLTGEKTQIVSKEAIVSTFIAQNVEITANRATILHVEPNPRGDKILFDYRHFKEGATRRTELQGFVNGDGTGVRWVPVRPMHVVWFDNETMFGVDTQDPEKKIYRYDLYGKKLELLGGRSTHVGSSSNREWYVGESDYYRPESDGFTRVYLYRRGQELPIAKLSEWKNSKITWDWVAHVDPSFSADGKRAYFIRAIDGKDKFEAVSIDLSEIDLK